MHDSSTGTCEALSPIANGMEMLVSRRTMRVRCQSLGTCSVMCGRRDPWVTHYNPIAHMDYNTLGKVTARACNFT